MKKIYPYFTNAFYSILQNSIIFRKNHNATQKGRRNCIKEMVQEEREVHVVFGERHCSCLQAAELCWAPLVCWTGSLVGRMESELAEDGEGFPSLQVSAEVKGAAGGYWAWGSLFRSSLSQYQKQVKKFKESKGGQLNPLVFLFFFTFVLKESL